MAAAQDLWKRRLPTATLQDNNDWLKKMRPPSPGGGLPNMGAAAEALTSHTRNLPQSQPEQVAPQQNIGRAGAMGAGMAGARMPAPAATGSNVLRSGRAVPEAPPEKQITSTYDMVPRGWRNSFVGTTPHGVAQGGQAVMPSGSDTVTGPSTQGTSSRGLVPREPIQRTTNEQPAPAQTQASNVQTQASTDARDEPDYSQSSDRINAEDRSDMQGVRGASTTRNGQHVLADGAIDEFTGGGSVEDVASQYGLDPGFLQSLLDQGAYIDGGYVYLQNEDGSYNVLGDLEDFQEGDAGEAGGYSWQLNKLFNRWQTQRTQRDEATADEEQAAKEKRAVDMLMGGIDRIDRIQGLDPRLLEQVLRTQRQQRDEAISRSRMEAMQAAANQGLGGAAVAGYGAETALPAELAGASQDAQMQLQFGLQDLQTKMSQTDRALSMISQIASIYAGSAEGDRILQAQKELLDYRSRLDQDMATFMQRFEPTLLEQAFMKLTDTAGTAIGTGIGTGLARKWSS